jgi:hypothetical protein
MVAPAEKIFSFANTMVSVHEKIFSATETIVPSVRGLSSDNIETILVQRIFAIIATH